VYYKFRKAELDDLPHIMEIIRQAVARMLREGKHQWDENYPTRNHIIFDISQGNGYLLTDTDGLPVCYGAILFTGEPAYKNIRGNWHFDMPYVVVHRLAVAESSRGKGISSVFLSEVETLSRNKDIHNFRIDTNYDNLDMQKVLSRCGFTYCGKIQYDKGERLAYEKMI